MGFKSFALGVLIRVILIALVAIFGAYLYLQHESVLQGVLFLWVLVLLSFNLISYVTVTNRKISRFLESIRYSDFSSSFTQDSNLGSSFKEMNMSFNEVIDAFKKTRAQKEE
ncbi:hypothetical protein [Cecembia lonarensis]|uniref:Uncharacterized protein n=1 Tax=Cecembia lonarensis (strain CCUG 58316 / KCTC 22772 / LW9) TaxID=1225176 RepID=K1L9T1_CECL9|nr:hypothetical protein [Cecembia lonarensis]EKB48977.1 hypothetical protein B879_02393 [Cecembia lonarensis LW9]